MIRVRLADAQYRDAVAAFLRLASLRVTYPDVGVDTFVVDFAEFDFDEEAQLRIVRRMLKAWDEDHQNGALLVADIQIRRSCSEE